MVTFMTKNFKTVIFTGLLSFGLICCSAISANAEEKKEGKWTMKGEIGISYSIDKNDNENKDIWQVLSDTDIEFTKKRNIRSWINKLNMDIGKKVEKTGSTYTPDVLEFDSDWRVEKSKKRYSFVNFSVDTNRKFKNDLLTSLTGGQGYKLNKFWFIEPGFGVVKNLKPSTDAEGLISLKAIYKHQLSNDIELIGVTEFIKTLGDAKDVIGKSEWKVKKRLFGNFKMVWDYRLDYKKSAPVSKTWYKSKVYLSYGF